MPRQVPSNLLMALPLVVLVSLAECNPKTLENVSHPTALCGAPSKLRFHGVHTVVMANPSITPEEARTISDGCAIISFGLDDAGKTVALEVELERPSSSGIGIIAKNVLSRNIYAPNGENLFGNQLPEGQNIRFAVTVGFVHENGQVAVAFRTPFAAHPTPADKSRPSEE